MKVFLTFNDNASGVYKSQVIKVIETLNSLQDEKFLLIAFIPRQNFEENKNKILSWYDNAQIFPIFPGIRFWKFIRYKYKRLIKKLNPSLVIARGPIATNFALETKLSGQTVIYDGRGAIKAEQEEFGVYAGKLGGIIGELEREAVLRSDQRIAVSNALISYWQKTFGYKKNEHVVIPCLAEEHQNEPAIQDSFFETNSPVLVYSGSTSPWQSFPFLIEKIRNWLNATNGKVLFLTKNDVSITALQHDFDNRIKNIFVKPHEVAAYLKACDYGLLIRENKVTNEVASPVKYSEYLSCGLKVILTDNILDYSDFTKEYSTGIIINPAEEIPADLAKLNAEEKNIYLNYIRKI